MSSNDHHAHPQQVTYTVPYWRVVRVRLWIATALFFTGAISQFLLAYYVPSLWKALFNGVVSIVQ